MPESRFATKLVFLLSGLIIWAAHFTAIYAFNALACARGFADLSVLGTGLVPLVIAVATLAALVAAGSVLLAAASGRGPGVAGEDDRSVSEFWRFSTMVLAALSLVAILWDGLPVLMIPPCA